MDLTVITGSFGTPRGLPSSVSNLEIFIESGSYNASESTFMV
jgi:hypothetical protein